MDSKNNFSIHFQTWKNKDAVNHILTEFKKYFPTNPIRLVSDNGADYEDFVDKFQLVYEFKEMNILPKAKLGGLEHAYEWLNRVNETCEIFDTDWIVIFEDDVLTQSDKIEYPYSDAGGFIVNPWKPELTKKLKERNTLNLNWGYGMCGGSVFKRNAFLDSYKKLDEFPLEELSKLDDRIIGFGDCLLNCFLQYFGYTYQIWDGMDDMSYPNYVPKKESVFVHGYKKMY